MYGTTVSDTFEPPPSLIILNSMKAAPASLASTSLERFGSTFVCVFLCSSRCQSKAYLPWKNWARFHPPLRRCFVWVKPTVFFPFFFPIFSLVSKYKLLVDTCLFYYINKHPSFYSTFFMHPHSTESLGIKTIFFASIFRQQILTTHTRTPLLT